MTDEEFARAASDSLTKATLFINLPSESTCIDVKFYHLRAQRRRTGMSFRKPSSFDDLRVAREFQKRTKRHLDQISRWKWRNLCNHLYRRKLKETYEGFFFTMPQQIYPFRAISLSLSLLEKNMVEVFCSQLTNNQVPTSRIRRRTPSDILDRLFVHCA